MERNKVFVDISVLVAATLSPRGGSFYILFHRKDAYQFQINEYVFEELLGVINEKFSSRRSDLLIRLSLILAVANIQILANPSKSSLRSLREVINQEDAPILASALRHSDYLLTLDHDFFKKEVKEFVKKRGFIICAPKEFLTEFS